MLLYKITGIKLDTFDRVSNFCEYTYAASSKKAWANVRYKLSKLNKKCLYRDVTVSLCSSEVHGS